MASQYPLELIGKDVKTPEQMSELPSRLKLNSYLFQLKNTKLELIKVYELHQSSEDPDCIQFMIKDAESCQQYIKDLNPLVCDEFFPTYAPIISHKFNDKRYEIVYKLEGKVPIAMLSKPSSECIGIILREAAKKLYHAQIVYGLLSPMNILFDIDTNNVSFLYTSAAKLINGIENISGDYKMPVESIYYSFIQRKEINQNVRTQALVCDIKALAMSIYEIGLNKVYHDCPVSLNHHTFSAKINGIWKLDVYNVLNWAHHKLNEDAYNESNQVKFKFLKSLFVTLITTKCNKLEYQKDVVDQISKTINNKAYPFKVHQGNMSLIKMIKEGVYLVKKSPDNSYIIKMYILKENSKDKISKEFLDEKKLYEHIEKITKLPSTSYVSYQNPKLLSLAKIDESIVTSENELVIVYGGGEITTIFPKLDDYKSKINLIMLNMFEIMNDLQIASIFHCDITPQNLVFQLNNMWRAILIDFGSSLIIDKQKESNDPDMKYLINPKGLTPCYAPPEMLQYLQSNNKKALLSPYKADLYSLAKTMLVCLVNCGIGTLDISRTFYDIKAYTYDDMYIEMYDRIINKESIESLEWNTDKLSKRIECKFFEENKELFLKNVGQFEYLKIDDIEMKKYISSFTSKFLMPMLCADPKERVPLNEISERVKYIFNLG